MRYTLKEIGDFCYEHKRHKGFKEFAIEQIYQHILWAANCGRLQIVADNKGLCAVVTYTLHPEQQRIYIHHIVAVRRGFESLVSYAMETFPGWSIQGLRRSELITFNQKKLWVTVHQVPIKHQTS